jgi:ABC-type amino acid transport substrate-binding protein
LKHHPKQAAVLPVGSLGEAIELLHAGAVEGVGTGSISARHHVRTNPNLTSLDVHQPNERVEEIAFAVRNSPLLLHKLNQFILDLKTPQI